MFFTAATFLSALALGASAKVYDIQVGGTDGQLLFNPEAIFASVGDQVVFHFHPKNHTVTQSSFAAPCSKADGGFDTGFMPVAANSTDAPPTQSYTVTDTSKPLWFYCKQAKDTPNFHCGKGMVFSINCPADPAPNSFNNFKKSALAIGAQLAASASAAPASSSASATDGGYGGAASSSPAASQTWSGYAAGTSVYSAAYGDATVPPPASVATVTQTVSLGSKTWTTTYASYPNSPDPTPNAEAKVIPVKVGANAQLVFDPPRVDAKPGDIISFSFLGANHSVTQSSFADPCRHLKNATTNELAGFDSGFQFVGNSTTPLVVNMTVNDTAPAWFYCKQAAKASHCGAGMVFSVNSDEKGPRNFAAYQSLAKQLNGTSAASTNGNASASGSADPSKATNGAGFTAASTTVVLGAVAFAVAALL